MSEFRELPFGGESNSLAENRVPFGKAYLASNVTVERGILEARDGYTAVGARTGAHTGDVGLGLGYGKYTGNTRYTLDITGGPTGGTFTLTLGDQTTGNIDWDATSAEVQAALEALSNVDVGDVYVYGGPCPTFQVYIEFQGQYANLGGTDVPTLTGADALTGGTTPGVTVTLLADGGEQEAFLVPVKKNGESDATMFSVDPDTGTYTEVTDGLNAGDWYFQQFQDRIYALNSSDGLNTFTLGGLWNNGAVSASSRPLKPTTAPTVEALKTLDWISFDATSSTTLSNVTESSTISIFGNATVFSVYSVNTGTNVAAGTSHELEITLNNTSSADDQDWRYADIWDLQYMGAGGMRFTVGSVSMVLIDTSDSPVTSSAYSVKQWSYNLQDGGHVFLMWGSKDRTVRDSVAKVKVTFQSAAWPKSGYNRFYFVIDDGYPSVDQSFWSTYSFEDGEKPPPAQFRYCYSYYDSATGESDTGPETTLDLASPPVWGWYNKVSAPASAEAAVDKVYFYRWDYVDSKWRRLANPDGTYGVTNTGTTVTFSDHFQTNEIQAFPEKPTVSFGGTTSAEFLGTAATQIGVWKQCLSVGSRKKIWVSAIGNPDAFAPDPDDRFASAAIDPYDDTQGVTEYVSDDRSEDVVGIHGQDNLYVLTEVSAYAKIGDKPVTATPPRRLPGSRGCIGTRASCKYLAGVLSASPDGLWFYQAARGYEGIDNGSAAAEEATRDVRTSWEWLVGTDGTGIVVAEHEGKVYVFNGVRMLWRTREGEWLRGTLAHSVVAAMSVRQRGLYFVDSTGALKVMGGTTDAGTGIEWSYETGIMDGFRRTVSRYMVQGDGEPTFKVETWDGAGESEEVSARREDGMSWVVPMNPANGFRQKLTVSGCKTDTVESVLIEIQGAPSARHN